MLEHLEPKQYVELRLSAGKRINKIDITEQKKAAVIRAITHSGNCYLFEVIDPENRRVHVVRGEGRPGVSQFGYLGSQALLSRVLCTGQVIHIADGTRTSRIEELVLVD